MLNLFNWADRELNLAVLSELIERLSCGWHRQLLMAPQIQPTTTCEVSDGYHFRPVWDASNRSVYNQTKFSAPNRLVPDRFLLAQDVVPKASTHHVVSSCAFGSPLKPTPLASFYKLHRIPDPSLPIMADLGQSRVATIDLPSRAPSEPMLSAEPAPAALPNGVHNKLLEQVIRTPDRLPSPQPTHFGALGQSPHRILHEEGPGYEAPKFDGKDLQMDQGNTSIDALETCADANCSSNGPDRRERIHPRRIRRIRDQLVLQRAWN